MCPNCPFRENGAAIHLQSGRLEQIKNDLLADDSATFICHKTVYNLDLDMRPTGEQPRKMCAGAYEYLLQIGRPNLSMRIAYAMGVDTPPE